MPKLYTRKMMSDIFPSDTDFIASYQDTYLYSYDATRISDDQLTLVYCLISSYFASTPIVSDSPEQWALRFHTLVWQKAPAFFAKDHIQKAVREITDADAELASKQITDIASSPEYTNQAGSELPHISSQTVARAKRGKLEALQAKWAMIAEDVAMDFIDSFRPLFSSIPRREIFPFANTIEDEEEE